MTYRITKQPGGETFTVDAQELAEWVRYLKSTGFFINEHKGKIVLTALGRPEYHWTDTRDQTERGY